MRRDGSNEFGVFIALTRQREDTKRLRGLY